MNLDFPEISSTPTADDAINVITVVFTTMFEGRCTQFHYRGAMNSFQRCGSRLMRIGLRLIGGLLVAIVSPACSHQHANSTNVLKNDVSVAQDLHAPQNTSVALRAIAGGVYDEHGAPLSHTRLELIDGYGGHPVSETATLADGQFSFDPISQGQFSIRASKAGYVSLELPGYPSLTTEQLNAGEGAVSHIKVVLRKGAVLAGTVEDNGIRIPGVEVSLLRRAISGGAESWVSTVPSGSNALTDDRGEFRIFGLAKGAYVIATRLRIRKGSIGYPTSYFPPPDGLGHFSGITLENGETRGVTVSVSPQLLLRVAGIVVDESGSPVAEGSVRLQQSFADRAPRLPVSQVAPIERTGEFHIEAVAPGTYDVVASVRPPIRPLLKMVQRIGAQRIHLTQSKSDMRIRVSRGWTARGRVRADATCLTGASPLAISAVPTGGEDGFAGTVGPAVVVNGSFELEGLFGRRFLSMSQGDRESAWFVKSVYWRDQDVTDDGLTGGTGQIVDDITVELSCKPTQLEFRLMGHPEVSGAPDPNYVVVPPSRENLTYHPSGRYVAVVRSEQLALVSGLPVGSYCVGAVLSGDRSTADQETLFARIRERCTSVQLRSDEIPTIDIEPIQ